MHWQRYGYINYHSPADPDRSTESIHWRGQIYCHNESSLWTGYGEIRITNSSILSFSTVRTPTPVWSLLPSGRRQQYESWSSVSPVEAKSRHEHTQGSIPWPFGLTERLGCSATSAIVPLHPEDGGSMILRNVSFLQQHRTTLQPRRLQLEKNLFSSRLILI